VEVLGVVLLAMGLIFTTEAAEHPFAKKFYKVSTRAHTCAHVRTRAHQCAAGVGRASLPVHSTTVRHPSSIVRPMPPPPHRSCPRSSSATSCRGYWARQACSPLVVPMSCTR
jgi:hypothetical protein